MNYNDIKERENRLRAEILGGAASGAVILDRRGFNSDTADALRDLREDHERMRKALEFYAAQPGALAHTALASLKVQAMTTLDEREAGLFLIYFDDADRRPELFTSRCAAVARYKQISVSWSAHFFERTHDKCDPAQATTYPASMLDEQITEIANKACVDQTSYYPAIVIKSACYAAIRAFAEREPSKAVIAKGQRILGCECLDSAVFQAMLLQALKELDHE